MSGKNSSRDPSEKKAVTVILLPSGEMVFECTDPTGVKIKVTKPAICTKEMEDTLNLLKRASNFGEFMPALTKIFVDHLNNGIVTDREMGEIVTFMDVLFR